MAVPVTALIVEDEPLLLMDIAEELTARGIHVLQASNADRALELLAEHPEIRVLFTDIDMPGSMDGLRLARAVRDRWPPVKIIVTSGHHTAPDDLPATSLFLNKPYQADAVVAAMRQLVG